MVLNESQTHILQGLTMIKFNKYNVTDTDTKAKARVWYSLDNRVDGRKCVTIYAKDYVNDLKDIFPDQVIDNSDSMTDYFEKGKVVLFEDHPLYETARAKAEA